MNTVITVVVIGAVIAMVVLMSRYANFIHRFPQEGDRDDKDETANTGEDPPDKGSV